MIRAILIALTALSSALWIGGQIGAAAYDARHINLEETP